MPFLFQPSMGQDAPTPYQGSPGGVGGSNGGNGDGTYYAPNPEYLTAEENYTAANSAYQKALARLNTQRLGSLRSAGYIGDVDPTTGLVKNIRVDTGNSFGGLQQLLHGQALEDQNANNAAEDRGLVGGLAHQGEAELHYEHQAQSGDFANQLLNTLSGYNDQQQQAKEALDNALFDLTHTAAQTAIDNGEYNPATTGDTGGGGGGGGSKSKAQTVAQKVAAASAAAFKAHGGKSTPGAALAARSAGLNAAYGLGKSRPAPAHRAPAHRPNAYTDGRKKRG